MTSLAIINAADSSDGTTYGTEPYFDGFSSLGFSVKWYQCSDYRSRADFPEWWIKVRGLGFPNRTVDMGINRLWVFPRRLRHLDAEVVLLADPTLVNVTPAHAKVMVRIHDLRPLTAYSDRFFTRAMYRYAFPRLRGAWRILVTTAMVRQQLVELGFDPDQLRVVPETHHLGLHPDHVERSVRRIRDRREVRVLFVGADRRHKNVDFVLKLAEQMATRDDPRYSFVIVSRLRRATQRRVEALRLTNLRVLPGVPAISQLYDESDVLAFPSLYEGFGRPLIEAMAFGLPILANRIPPLFEVLGDAGVLLDTDNLVDWVEALGALADPVVFESHAQRSLRRGETYLPDRFRTALSDAMGGL